MLPPNCPHPGAPDKLLERSDLGRLPSQGVQGRGCEQDHSGVLPRSGLEWGPPGGREALGGRGALAGGVPGTQHVCPAWENHEPLPWPSAPPGLKLPPRPGETRAAVSDRASLRPFTLSPHLMTVT